LETLLSSPAYQEKMFPQGKETEAAFLLGIGFESYPGVVERVLNNARRLQGLATTQVYVLTGNMKVAAPGLERAFTRAREEGVLFFRSDHELPVFEDGDSGIRIEFRDGILDRTLTLKPQVLIVDETLAPQANLEAVAGLLEIPLDQAWFISPDQAYALPNRTPRRGIYAVGGSRRPVSETRDIIPEAEEAVLSAVELIGRGQQTVEAPRVEVDRKKCTICLTCVRSCPHQAITFRFRRPQVSPLACQVCGICSAECPMDAIQIKNFRDRGIRQEVSEFFHDRKYDVLAPQVVVFCCQNSADKTVRQALLFREPLPIGFDFIQIPCAGKLDPDYVLHALREGADAVLILACPIEACKSFEGNRKARERIQFLQDQVRDLGLEPERILFETVAPGMVAQLTGLLGEAEIRIRSLGISPVRRFRGIQKIYDKFTLSVDNKLFVISP
jgi:coenzyme F420-reducing hydrogenase delta subunit/Pyruvate/2-oxoacid:ferredoxin oxidoreductase delta subunit